jgi:hypothetical protein
MEEDTTTDRECTLSADELVSLCVVIHVMMGQGQGLNVVLFNLLIVIID